MEGLLDGRNPDFVVHMDDESIFQRISSWGARSSRRPQTYIFMQTAVPEDLNSDIPPALWSRFRAHCIAARYKNQVYLHLVSGLIGVPYMILVYVDIFSGAGFSDSNYFLAYSILVIITILYGRWKGNQVRTENYRTIAQKMLPSFQNIGFELVYSASNNWLWDSDSVMTLSNFSDMEAPAQDPESERAPFQPEHWKPLEGRWERVSSRSQSMVPDMVFKIASLTWEFGNASAEEDFWGLNEMRGFFCCVYPKDTFARYYAKGNALEFQPEETGQSKLFVRLKSQSIIEPIPSNGPVYYFRNGPSHIFQVDDNTMKIYVFEFQEDVPNDADLLTGALDNLPADGSCGSCYTVLEQAKSVATPVTIV